MDGCRFCAIAAGGRDTVWLYRDESTMAFLDANPAVEGHTLVVPDRHVTGLLALEESEYFAVLGTARKVGAALSDALDPDGFSVFHTTGDLVGSVEHAHVHLVPRWTGDGVHLALDRTHLAGERPPEWVDAVRAALEE